MQLPNDLITRGLVFEGRLDVDALGSSIDAVTECHEALRLTFPETEEPTVVVTDRGGGLDLLPDRPATLEEALERLVEEARRPFDMATGPLFRASLIGLPDGRHVLGLAFHHIIGDGQSADILVRDLLRIFEARLNGGEAELPELPVQFMDYAEWEREYLQGETLDRMLGYWRTKLAGVAPIPASGLADPGGEVGREPGFASVSFSMNEKASAEVRARARSERTSVFSFLATGLAVAMRAHRSAALGPEEGSDVALFGSLANRMHAETLSAFGYFATPAVYRTVLSGDPTLREALAAQSVTVMEAVAHQEIPHALLTRELDPAQYGVRFWGGDDDVPRYVNFDVLRSDGSSSVTRLPGLTITKVGVHVKAVPRGGIRVLGHESAQTLSVQVRYRTDWYSRAWAERFTADIGRTLDAMTNDPGQRLSSVLTPWPEASSR